MKKEIDLKSIHFRLFFLFFNALYFVVNLQSQPPPPPPLPSYPFSFTTVCRIEHDDFISPTWEFTQNFVNNKLISKNIWICVFSFLFCFNRRKKRKKITREYLHVTRENEERREKECMFGACNPIRLAQGSVINTKKKFEKRTMASQSRNGLEMRSEGRQTRIRHKQ